MTLRDSAATSMAAKQVSVCVCVCEMILLCVKCSLGYSVGLSLATAVCTGLFIPISGHHLRPHNRLFCHCLVTAMPTHSRLWLHLFAHYRAI